MTRTTAWSNYYSICDNINLTTSSSDNSGGWGYTAGCCHIVGSTWVIIQAGVVLMVKLSVSAAHATVYTELVWY